MELGRLLIDLGNLMDLVILYLKVNFGVPYSID